MAHLSHMTSEDLRSKSRIAVELTRRDIEIDRLTCTNKSLTQYLHIQRDALDAYTESPLGKRVAELEIKNFDLKKVAKEFLERGDIAIDSEEAFMEKMGLL